MKISIVVPVYNEESNLEHFVGEVEKVMAQLPYEYEILFVDDGSQDLSREILNRLELEDEHVGAIFLAQNYGHQIALTCGLEHADADAVITMDGDMQHPPALIPELLAEWNAGFDVVQTIRQSTEEITFFKRVTSKLYYRLLNFISDVEILPGSSDFRLMSRRAVLAFRKYREHDKFIRGLVKSMGFRQTTIEFIAPKRFAGTSKFSLKKMLHLALDGVLAHSTTPLRMAFYAGLMCGLFSVALLVHVLYETAIDNVVPGWATITIAVSFFGGLQLVFLGIVGEYISRIFREVKNRPLYFIEKEKRQRTN